MRSEVVGFVRAVEASASAVSEIVPVGDVSHTPETHSCTHLPERSLVLPAHEWHCLPHMKDTGIVLIEHGVCMRSLNVDVRAATRAGAILGLKWALRRSLATAETCGLDRRACDLHVYSTAHSLEDSIREIDEGPIRFAGGPYAVIAVPRPSQYASLHLAWQTGDLARGGSEAGRLIVVRVSESGWMQFDDSASR